MTTLPMMCAIRRKLPEGDPVAIEARLQSAWQEKSVGEKVAGKRIAIGIGSRGVAEIPTIARQLAALVRESGGDPFIIPAMGSHGGATPEGQIEVLHGLGVTEESAGCPVRATMETVVLGHTPRGLPVHLDRLAAEADGLIIANRVKIHTDFHEAHESGLLKMLAVGLGKENGAAMLHSYGVRGIRDDMPEVAAVSIRQSGLIAGVAIVEDGYHRPVEMELLTPDEIIPEEQRLLELSRTLTPRLPVEDIDVLIVDELGKDISGSGMDTNVIGRMWIKGQPEPESPRIKAIVVLDVTAPSHGNAIGVGLADFTVRRLLDKIDFSQMTKNVFTSGFLERGRIPIVYETDAEAIQAAVEHVFRAEPEQRQNVRIVRIRNTMELERLWVSANLLGEVMAAPDFLSNEAPLPFDFYEGALL